MEDTWRINAFAPFVYGSLYVAASTKKLRLGTYDPPQYKARSQVLADEILDLVVNEGKEEIIVIGRSESRGKIRAFRIPIDNVDGLDSLGRSVDTGLDGYNRVTECCCFFEDEDTETQGVLIASMNGERKLGRLSVVYFD